MDIVVEVIKEDPSSVDLLNRFLQNGVIWKYVTLLRKCLCMYVFMYVSV